MYYSSILGWFAGPKWVFTTVILNILVVANFDYKIVLTPNWNISNETKLSDNELTAFHQEQ